MDCACFFDDRNGYQHNAGTARSTRPPLVTQRKEGSHPHPLERSVIYERSFRVNSENSRTLEEWQILKIQKKSRIVDDFLGHFYEILGTLSMQLIEYKNE